MKPLLTCVPEVSGGLEWEQRPFSHLAAKPLAPDITAPTRITAGAVNEPSAILVRFTGLAKAISASEGRFVLDFARGTTIFSGSVFFFPDTFMRKHWLSFPRSLSIGLSTRHRLGRSPPLPSRIHGRPPFGKLATHASRSEQL
jgi:hypothetical protein